MGIWTLVLVSLVTLAGATNTTYCEISLTTHMTMGWKFFDDSIEITLKVRTN
jgi:hypothetical protein